MNFGNMVQWAMNLLCKHDEFGSLNVYKRTDMVVHICNLSFRSKDRNGWIFGLSGQPEHLKL